MKLRYIYNKVLLALPLMAAWACSNDGGDDPARGGTPLTIDLVQVAQTRAAITGSTLPDGSQYGVTVGNALTGELVAGGMNTRVDYRGGQSTLSSEVLLNGNDYNVWAYYPYNAAQGSTTLHLDARTQTDYLYGTAVTADGAATTVNEDRPVARIQLHHAMALLRFNIWQDQTNTETNTLTAVEVNERPIECDLNLTTGETTFDGTQQWPGISTECNITVGTTPQTVEVLVVPCDTRDFMNLRFVINGKYHSVNKSLIVHENHCYTYNVEIQSDGKLRISEATIEPRTNTNMDQLTVTGHTMTVGGTVANAVDLGLSVLWADHNIGATSPTDPGGYYIWGDPTGTRDDNSYTRPPYTNIVGTEWDIAHVQWGDGWHLPTNEQCKELVDNCKIEYGTADDGTKCFKLTSKVPGYTGNYILLPCGGYYKSFINPEPNSAVYVSGERVTNSVSIGGLYGSGTRFYWGKEIAVYYSDYTFPLYTIRPVHNK